MAVRFQCLMARLLPVKRAAAVGMRVERWWMRAGSEVGWAVMREWRGWEAGADKAAGVNGADEADPTDAADVADADRKSTRLNSSHITPSRMPSSA